MNSNIVCSSLYGARGSSSKLLFTLSHLIKVLRFFVTFDAVRVSPLDLPLLRFDPETFFTISIAIEADYQTDSAGLPHADSELIEVSQSWILTYVQTWAVMANCLPTSVYTQVTAAMRLRRGSLTNRRGETLGYFLLL